MSKNADDRWILCWECGYITAADLWLHLNYNPAYEDKPYEPLLIAAESDPSICRCPACGHDHKDDDSGAGFIDGTREALIVERDRTESEGWSWEAA